MVSAEKAGQVRDAVDFNVFLAVRWQSLSIAYWLLASQHPSPQHVLAIGQENPVAVQQLSVAR